MAKHVNTRKGKETASKLDSSIPSNRLILGDNLLILREMPDSCIDLIYLDPPFFSNRNYEVIWGDKGEVRSFEDRWSGGVDHYIAWLKERVQEMHRILKPTGSIFLHCDWHANSYIRVLILDKIFGANCFRNEIIWCYLGPGSPGVKQFLRKHDTIYWYSKSPENWKFNVDKVRFKHSEKTFQNYKEGLVGSGFEGAPRLINKLGKVPEDWWNDIINTQGSIKMIDKFMLLVQEENTIDDWFDDVTISARFPRNSPNNLGYPTQKPIALLNRIINATTDDGDVVLDPFVGGGTTVAVADELSRRWIGIDQSVVAVKVTEQRLNKQQPLFRSINPFTVELHKYDYDTLRYSDAFEFEQFIVHQYGGTPNIKQRSDLGIDGRSREGTPIQVKRSDDIGRDVVDKFVTACRRYDKSLYEKRVESNQIVGTIIAFSFGKGIIQEVARLKNEENIHIELKPVEEIVLIAKKPKVTLSVNSLGKDAKGLHRVEIIANSDNTRVIENYIWDFHYDRGQGFRADVFVDRVGRQFLNLKTGSHEIAVKAIDQEGLEGMESIIIQVNGVLTTK